MGTQKPMSSRGKRITLWILAGFFLLLSAWLIPGSIWGTSGNSPLSGGRAFIVSIPILLIALLLLWLAVRAQRQGDTPKP
ncbi:MAG: hypothetical protein ACYC2K_11125 [Gemmatimonadales bacterium]